MNEQLRAWLACACGVPVGQVTDAQLAKWAALRADICDTKPTEAQARGVRAIGHQLGVHFRRAGS